MHPPKWTFGSSNYNFYLYCNYHDCLYIFLQLIFEWFVFYDTKCVNSLKKKTAFICNFCFCAVSENGKYHTL